MNNLVIDIDGTICPIKKQNVDYMDLVPYFDFVEKIKEYKKKGFKITLFTSRNMRTYNGDLDLILEHTKPVLEKWLTKWGIPYDELIFGKPWPGKDGFYIDDRAVRPKEFLSYNSEELKEICDKDRNLKNSEVDDCYEYVFKINDINLKIKSNKKKIIQNIVEKYSNFYEQGSEPVDFTINYSVGMGYTFGIKYKEKNQKDFSYINKRDNNLDVFMEDYNIEDEAFVKRIFTTTLIKVLQEKGYSIIHGACVSKNGEGIIISGSKRAGKTTTLLNLLNRGYDYVCNDRVAVKKEDNDYIAIGIPFSMGIILKDAKRLFDISKFPKASDIDEEKIYLENYQIPSVLDVNSQSVVKLKSILVPKYNENITEIEPRLVSNLTDLLGTDNIMTTNSIPEEKNFFNDIFKTKYRDSSFLNEIESYYVEQSSVTFDQLSYFIKNSILKGENQNVLRLTRTHE